MVITIMNYDEELSVWVTWLECPKNAKDEVKRPKGSPDRSQALERPYTYSIYVYTCIHLIYLLLSWRRNRTVKIEMVDSRTCLTLDHIGAIPEKNRNKYFYHSLRDVM